MRTAHVAMHDWQNSAVIGINKRKAHVPLWSFRSGPDALRRVQTGVDDETCGRTYLSAPDWKFRLFDRPVDVQQDFCQPAFDANSWDQVRVLPHPLPTQRSAPIGTADGTKFSVCEVTPQRPAKPVLAWHWACFCAQQLLIIALCAAADPRAQQLGVRGPRHANVHQHPVSVARGPAVRVARQPHRLLPASL